MCVRGCVCALTLLLVSCGPPHPAMNCGLREEFQTQNLVSFLFSPPEIHKRDKIFIYRASSWLIFTQKFFPGTQTDPWASSTGLTAGHKGLGLKLKRGRCLINSLINPRFSAVPTRRFDVNLQPKLIEFGNWDFCQMQATKTKNGAAQLKHNLATSLRKTHLSNGTINYLNSAEVLRFF